MSPGQIFGLSALALVFGTILAGFLRPRGRKRRLARGGDTTSAGIAGDGGWFAASGDACGPDGGSDCGGGDGGGGD
ncbi:hypothetical protein [Jiella sonneratiae]|uniref:Uncharacterized protein n=1 Tax=Jiella sonneratiae TaxID=2816856 RepID=A0ABS3J772_9HYPH|nr:hypothetical protein [Jiella sonneratiae]MBO0905524.1 hypothetical protein [Jiella sonneratiae]